MAARKGGQRQLTAPARRLILKHEAVVQGFSLARLIVKAGAWVVAAWICRGMVSDLAGRETLVALKLAFLADWRLTASVSLTGAACAWAFVERWLKHRTVRQMSKHIKELEARIDPARTSSRLTAEGKTNPEDTPR